MKMSGKVIEYSEQDELGYIEGYDGVVYLFHEIQVKNDVKIAKNSIVRFDFVIQDSSDMPYAVDIEVV